MTKKLHPWLKKHLVCPLHKGSLEFTGDKLVCREGHSFPVIDGVPVMLLKEVKLPCYPRYEDLWNRVNKYLQEKGRIYEFKGYTNSIDPYVNKIIVGTCGNLYKGLQNRLKEYPIPELILPKGNNDVFLDIGCNWGRWSISAAKKGYLTIGIDPSIDAIMAAKRVAEQYSLNVIYVVADSRFLPFDNDSFDIVFSYSVLQHFYLENVKLTLQEINRVLKHKGLSLIQMANKYGVRNLYIQSKRKFRQPEDFDVRYWSPHMLLKTFSTFIGPSYILADGFLSLNPQITDIRILPPFNRFIVITSEFLKYLSRLVPFIKYFADSVYIISNTQKKVS